MVVGGTLEFELKEWLLELETLQTVVQSDKNTQAQNDENTENTKKAV